MPSTSTRLQVMNSSLQAVGERSVSSFNEDATSEKALTALRDALSEISTADSWLWLYRRSNPTAWNDEVATVPGVTKLVDVSWGTKETGHYPVTYIRSHDFYRRQIIATDDANQRPSTWTFLGDDKIVMTPYPTTPEGQAKIWVQYYVSLTLPATDGSVFDCPETVIPLIIQKVSALLALRLLADNAAYQTNERHYSFMLQQMRSMQRTTDHSTSMFR